MSSQLKVFVWERRIIDKSSDLCQESSSEKYCSLGSEGITCQKSMVSLENDYKVRITGVFKPKWARFAELINAEALEQSDKGVVWMSFVGKIDSALKAYGCLFS